MPASQRPSGQNCSVLKMDRGASRCLREDLMKRKEGKGKSSIPGSRVRRHGEVPCRIDRRHNRARSLWRHTLLDRLGPSVSRHRSRGQGRSRCRCLPLPREKLPPTEMEGQPPLKSSERSRSRPRFPLSAESTRTHLPPSGRRYPTIGASPEDANPPAGEGDPRYDGRGYHWSL